ncbi:hypothetical protein [Asticcacaulis benevestitus]|nr:hypothetical protein [Asticcacaulis benevestitus]
MFTYLKNITAKSFAVCGFRERSGRADVEPTRRVSALKSAGAIHAVMFGRHGALMLSLDLRDELDVPLRNAADWRPLSQAAELAIWLTGEDRRIDQN